MSSILPDDDRGLDRAVACGRCGLVTTPATKFFDRIMRDFDRNARLLGEAVHFLPSIRRRLTLHRDTEVGLILEPFVVVLLGLRRDLHFAQQLLPLEPLGLYLCDHFGRGLNLFGLVVPLHAKLLHRLPVFVAAEPEGATPGPDGRASVGQCLTAMRAAGVMPAAAPPFSPAAFAA
jgi:hypothetical protein